MTDSQNPRGRDYTADVRAALDRLRGYAADHSADLLGAIDKIGDAIDRQTGGRFAAGSSRSRRLGTDPLCRYGARSHSPSSGMLA